MRDSLSGATELLSRAGVDEPRRNAEMLLAAALKVDRAEILLNPQRRIEAAQLRAYADLIRRRAERAPLQYLTGRVGFMDFEMKADHRALIPRPETELLVEAAVKLLEGAQSPIICDVGTGSGCITVALARALPTARVFATDVSADALDLAAENADALGVADRVTFHAGDLFAAVGAFLGTFDAVCSNPPYISPEEFDKLPDEVREHEPRLALLAGEDGTELHRRLIEAAPKHLKPGGYLLLELPAGRRDRICACVAAVEGIRLLDVVRDYGGIERVLVAQRHQP